MNNNYKFRYQLSTLDKFDIKLEESDSNELHFFPKVLWQLDTYIVTDCMCVMEIDADNIF